ncbi:CaiB/BaiF CoA-transferase family protein [Jatrophihabitans sp.]|uniref:CaiB/BaiF CoA transferase family protein n=1 Tax=Jatrophihabitans sp. TaxID=1932789 RepID=UPI0030C758E0|nr:putative acyl-CoA transferase/carnitine dehydratase [Jatrophihabitans sp.]
MNTLGSDGQAPGAAGPLSGLRVIEMDALGPVPHAAMILADAGAAVVRVVRSGGPPDTGTHPLLRGRRTVALNLKSEDGREAVLALLEESDVLLEGFRPGVMERLGLGPADCAARNPGLIYGRMTGWGQTGPLADRAGHDINYISLTGALHAIGEAHRAPIVPLNLVGDYGGGSMLLLVGVLSALWERERTGQGQVVDAAMVDGVLSLQQLIWDLRSNGLWNEDRQSNQLDGGAPFYRTYPCSDGRWVAVGALEPQFYRLLIEGLGLAGEELPEQLDEASWPALAERIASVFATQPRDHWAETFADVDACVTPVLSYDEVRGHPHVAARAGLIEVDGVVQAAPVPRFSGYPTPR